MIRAGSVPLRVIVAEARRNLATFRALDVVKAVFFFAVGAAVLSADGVTVRTLLDDQAAFVDAGGYVYVVRGTIDPSSCRRAASGDRIKRVGAARYVRSVTIEGQPGRDIALIEVAGQTATIWANESVTVSDIAIGAILRDGLSAPATSSLRIEGQERTLAVDRVIPPDRHPPTARALIIPTGWIGTFDECWIEFEPITRSLAASIAGTVNGGIDAEISTLAVRPPGSEPLDARFQARSTQWAWLLGAGLTTLLVALAELSRRSEQALYAILGWRGPENALRRVMEALGVLLLIRSLLLFVSAGVAIAFFEPSRFELSLLLEGLLLLTFTELLGTLIVVTLVQPRDLITTLRGV